MNLLDYFRRRRDPIRDTAGLADFIDRNAAFLVQKGIYEYSRARAGHYAKVLFAEQAFLQSVELSRWRAFPLGLAMVGEMVEGALREWAGAERRAASVEPVARLVLDVFDRYPVPAPLGPSIWREARIELARRLDQVGLHPPKRVIDIPEPLAEEYFSLMPIHEKLRGRDFPTIRNYLRVTLCNIHDELTRDLDGAAVVTALRAPTQ